MGLESVDSGRCCPLGSRARRAKGGKLRGGVMKGGSGVHSAHEHQEGRDVAVLKDWSMKK